MSLKLKRLVKKALKAVKPHAKALLDRLLSLGKHLIRGINVNTVLLVYLITQVSKLSEEMNNFITASYINFALLDMKILMYVQALAEYIKPLVELFTGSAA